MSATVLHRQMGSTQLWAGRIISSLVILFLVFDSVIKLMQIEPVKASFAGLGYPVTIAPVIGIIEAICVVLYVIPRTAILGAVLLTGLLGGAIASHLRLGDPMFTHVLFGVYVGVLAWAALWLRDASLRSLLPWRRM